MLVAGDSILLIINFFLIYHHYMKVRLCQGWRLELMLKRIINKDLYNMYIMALKLVKIYILIIINISQLWPHEVTY